MVHEWTTALLCLQHNGKQKKKQNLLFLCIISSVDLSYTSYCSCVCLAPSPPKPCKITCSNINILHTYLRLTKLITKHAHTHIVYLLSISIILSWQPLWANSAPIQCEVSGAQIRVKSSLKPRASLPFDLTHYLTRCPAFPLASTKRNTNTAA